MKSFDKKWEELHKTLEWGRYPNEDVVRYVARNYYKCDRTSVKILDLGCGAGANTFFLAREGFDTYAIDGSPAAVTKTEQYLRSYGLKAHTQVGDMAELPYGDAMFDVVIDAMAICSNTVKGINDILFQCHRILKNGGALFSTGLFKWNCTGAGSGEKIEEGTYRQETHGVLVDRGTIHYFNADEIHQLFGDAGFTVESIDETVRTEYNGTMTIAYYTVLLKKV